MSQHHQVLSWIFRFEHQHKRRLGVSGTVAQCLGAAGKVYGPSSAFSPTPVRAKIVASLRILNHYDHEKNPQQVLSRNLGPQLTLMKWVFSPTSANRLLQDH